MHFEIQAMKAAIFVWMESILLGHIYHMINNDSITGYTVKNNHRSLWSKRSNRKSVFSNTY